MPTQGASLFQKESLQDEMKGRLSAFLSEVDKIPPDQFDASTDEEIVAYINARARLSPLELNEDGASIEFESVSVDVSLDTRRIYFERPKGPVYVNGRRAVISIPFTGDDWLFTYKTNPHFPYAKLIARVEPARTEGEESVLHLLVDAANDEPQDSFEQMINEQRKLLRMWVQASTGQTNSFNQFLDSNVFRVVRERRQRVSQHHQIAAKLNIPLKRRETAPPLDPVPLTPRYVPPLSGTNRKTPSKEFGISPDQYALILHFIRHQGRTYESTPDTYAMHDEEGLRDIILGQLNGHFVGNATGETFRCKGKTDIRIEADDRSAFIAECKLWTGQAGLQKALQQLLGYVMWRDSKAALVLFNKSTTRISTVLERIPDAIVGAGLAVQNLKASGKGEWSLMIQREANDDHIDLTVFAFDIRPRRTA